MSVDRLGSPRLISNSRYRLGAHTRLPFGTEWSDGE